MVVDRVVVPILHAAAQWPRERHRNQIDARFHEPPREQTLLPPGIAAVTIAQTGIFTAHVKCPLGFGAGEHFPCHLFERIHGLHVIQHAGGPLHAVELLPQRHPRTDASGLRRVLHADIGDAKVFGIGIGVDGKRFIGRAQVGSAEIGNWAGPNIIRQRPPETSPRIIRDGQKIGMVGAGIELPDVVTSKHLLLADPMAESGVHHRPQDGELIRNARMAGQEFADVQTRDIRGDRIKRPAVFRRGVRLGIVGFEVARSAVEKDEN